MTLCASCTSDSSTTRWLNSRIYERSSGFLSRIRSRLGPDARQSEQPHGALMTDLVACGLAAVVGHALCANYPIQALWATA